MPYNAGLLLKYECHINVEVCSTVKAIQYLYKYVYKGNDRTTFALRKELKEKTGKEKILIDEIKNYIDSRYIGAAEAFWKLANFFVHGRYPKIMPLPVHLPLKQRTRFWKGYNERKTRENAIKGLAKAKRTKLTAWFEKNAEERKAFQPLDKSAPHGFDLLYHVWCLSGSFKTVNCTLFETGIHFKMRNESYFELHVVHLLNCDKSQLESPLDSCRRFDSSKMNETLRGLNQKPHAF